jgi:hypothetical protein
VVEHAVEHHLQASPLGVGRQAAEVFARAVLGRDGLEVQRVVLVVGEGEVDRVQVQHVRAEVLHMVEPRGRALQVAAPEVELVSTQFLLGQVGAGLGRLGPGAKHLGRRVQRALGFEIGRRREAVDQHLVDDGTVAPIALAVFVGTGVSGVSGEACSRHQYCE